MIEELENYVEQDQFDLHDIDDLDVVIEDLPNEPGVISVYSIVGGKENFVFIASSGEVDKEGGFGKNTIKSLFTGKNEACNMQAVFEEQFAKNNADSYRVYWFVTSDKEFFDIPNFVKGRVIQEYFDMHNELPPWNDKF